MNTTVLSPKAFRAAQIFALLGAITAAPLQSQGSLTVSRSIPLPGVEGRIDHLAIDASGERLFVAALGNNSLEVVDLRSFSVAHRIGGLSEPQGVAFVSERNKIYITNAGSGECDVYDGNSYELLKRLNLGGNADNVHYSAASHQLLVAAGNGLSFIDTASDAVVGRVDLPGHPEGFALEQNGPRVLANVPLPTRSIFTVDRERIAIIGQWPVGGLFSNFFSNASLSFDEDNQRLFVGVNIPARLSVLNAASGEVVAGIGIDGDPNDNFYDAKRHGVYVSCSGGYLDVVAQLAPDRYESLDRIPTAPGARTSLWVPERDQLFLAVPRRGNRAAEVRIYEPGPP
jgi:DNA-binding beta-propeller fold protein YncE